MQSFTLGFSVTVKKENIPYTFIPLPYEFMTDEFIEDPIMMKLVRYIMQMIRPYEHKYKFKNNGRFIEINLKPFAFVFGREMTANACCASEKNIRTRMQKLRASSWVEKSASTVCEKSASTYSIYTLSTASFRKTEGQQLGQQLRPAVGPAVPLRDKSDRIAESKESKESIDLTSGSFRMDCSYVDKSEPHQEKSSSATCQHTQQSSEDPLDIKISIRGHEFALDSYRLPDQFNSPLSAPYQKAIKKYTDQNYEKFLRNLILFEERCSNGTKPNPGNTYEQMLAGYVKNDYAGREIFKEQNRIFAELIQKENPDLEMKILKTVVHVYSKGEVHESLRLELNPISFGESLKNYANFYDVGVPI
jgi:hypothetical protein